ncbi:MAG: hypothetical protein ACUVRK_02485 [Spirochaetota bacterium]
MRITNTNPAVTTPQATNRKVSVQTLPPIERIQVFPSLKKALSAYSIISEAHQLVTMAINISHELIQKAFSSQLDNNEILAKFATIHNYFTRLSPGTVFVPNIPQSETVLETTNLIEQFQDAVKTNDTASIKSIYDTLIAKSQILDNTQQQLYMVLNQTTANNKPDINAVKSAIEQSQHLAFYAHKSLQYDHVQKLLA